MRHLVKLILVVSVFAVVGLFRPNSPLNANTPRAATQCSSGFADTFPCSNIDLLSQISNADLGAVLEANDLWGWTDSRDDREYALVGLDNGTAFVDITNPTNPILLGNLATHSLNSIWRDIKIHSDHAYIGSEAPGHGIQVFDLSQLRDVISPPVTFSATAHYDGIAKSHNVVSNEDSNFIYAVGGTGGTQSGCGGGLHAIDVSTPANPTFAGCQSTDDYSHDAQCVIYKGPDSNHVGKEICFGSNEDTINVFDVTTKSAPVELSETGYAGSEYAHQGWLTEDHRYFISNDEVDEMKTGANTRTFIWDMSDLDNVPEPSVFTGADSTIDHNLYIKDGLVYQANYRAGLRILESDDIANGNLSEIGYFDIYPTNNNTSFNGAWSNFPYFDSGVVVISGIEQGLITVRPTFEDDFALAVTPSRLTRCGDAPVTVSLDTEQVGAFGGAISISAESNPSHTVTPITTTVNAGSSQPLQITSGGIATGTYAITLQGSTLTKTHTTTLLLHQIAAPIGTVPAPNASDVGLLPGLLWTGGAGVNVQVEVATDAGFSNIIVDQLVETDSYQLASSLDTDTTYFWRLSAETGSCANIVSWSGAFTTESTPTAVTLARNEITPNSSVVILFAVILLMTGVLTFATKKATKSYIHGPA